MQNDESLDFTGEVEALRSKPQAHPSGEADDAADFEKQLKALQLGENRLKFLLRQSVAIFLALCVVIVMGVFLAHLVLPEQYRWLSSDDLDVIKDMSLTIFGGLAMSIGTMYLTRQ